MKIITIGVLVLTLGASAAFGSKPAMATSSTPFQLRGETVTVDGVPSWVIAPGDELVAGASNVSLTLPNGSRVRVLAGTKVRYEEDSKGVLVRVLSGAVRILDSAPGFRLFVLNQSVNASAGQTVGSVNASASSSVGNTPAFDARIPRPVSRQ